MVHILSIDELLPYSPVDKYWFSKCVLKEMKYVEVFGYKMCTYMSLEGVGFGEGVGRFPSIISLKLLFPTFLASCGRKGEKAVIRLELC